MNLHDLSVSRDGSEINLKNLNNCLESMANLNFDEYKKKNSQVRAEENEEE